MLPIHDENPVQITPYVTYGLIILNVLVFLYELTLSAPMELTALFHTWAVIPEQLTASFLGGQSIPFDIHEWLTLFTSQFLHAGPLHLAGNMLYLWVFGNNVEEQLGRVRFLLLYLACGVFAALIQWYIGMFSEAPSLGASGAIAGVMGVYIFKFPDVRILAIVPFGHLFLPLRVPAFFYLGFWFLQQATSGIASLSVPTNVGMADGGIAYWGHAGGFVFGLILGTALRIVDYFNEESSPAMAEKVVCKPGKDGVPRMLN